MHKWTIAALTACSLLLAGCATQIEGTAQPDWTATEADASPTPVTSADLSLTQMCESLVLMLESLGTLDPDADRSETLKSVFEESRSSGEWKTTPLDERHRIEEAFARAESGRC